MNGGRTNIERASTNDLVMLAAEGGGHLAETMGAVLVLSGGPHFDIESAQRLIAERIRNVPRLRQRLIRVPLGCGRPVWVDDPQFDAGQHIRHLTCPAPGDEAALLQLAVAICTEKLPPTKPLWAAVLVTGLVGDTVALVVVLHHVLADGIGGLAVLQSLVDRGAPAAASPALRPRPSHFALSVDALSSSLRALSRLPAVAREFPKSLRSAGGLHPPAAAPSSLLHRTGPRRQVAVARIDLGLLRSATRANGATVNDAVLAAATGALRELLARRGETLDEFLVTVPVTGRPSASAAELGNDNTLLVVKLPGAGDLRVRLRRISDTVRAARVAATGPSLAALFGPLFRVLAVLGAYRAYLHRQRRVHTIVSNVRGPSLALTLAGLPIESIIPISVAELGNITITFVALSYAGTLTVTAVVDPDLVPDLPILVGALQAELDAVTALAAAGSQL